MKNFFSFFSKRFKVYGAVIVLGASVAGFVFLKNGGSNEETFVVYPNNFVQQVSVSGKVVATEMLDLSFEQGGRVTNVRIKVGDLVATGQLLASQDTAQLDAQLAETQAGIDLQKAKLDQLLAGASPEDITIANTAVANAEVLVANAEQALKNAKQNLIDKLRDAYTKSDDAVRGKADQLIDNPRSSNPSIPYYLANGQLKIDTEKARLFLEYTIDSWQSSLGQLTPSSDITSYTSEAEKNLNQVISFLDKAARIVNSASANSNLTQATIDKWKTDISAGRANVNNAVANLTSAEENLTTREASLKTAEGSLKNAQDQLALKEAPARSPDVAIYEAQIRQAEANAQNVVTQLSKKQIRSPISGVVTIMNLKVGSIATANEAVISLISTDTFQIESYVPEKNIPFINVGNHAAISLDAYGNDVSFAANVISIDPAETIRDGVSTYRTTLQFVDRDQRIKSGMTANVLITTKEKLNTIAVPQGIVMNKDGKKFVKVKEGNTTIDRNVETGSVSSLGQVEIISGLKDGDVVILKQTNK